MIDRVEHAVLVVVGIGTAVSVLESVLVFGRVGASVDLVEQAVVIAIRGNARCRVVDGVHAEKEYVRVVGTQLAVGLEDVNEAHGGPDAPAAHVEQEVEARLQVGGGAEETSGRGRAEMPRRPDPGELRRTRRIVRREGMSHDTERADHRVRPAMRHDGGVARRITVREEQRRSLELRPELRQQRQLGRDETVDTEGQLVLLVPADGLADVERRVKAHVLGVRVAAERTERCDGGDARNQSGSAVHASGILERRGHRRRKHAQ